VWVGIDTGKHAHHAAAVAADGQLVWSRRVANDQAAIAELIGQATASAAGVCWAVDSTCSDSIEIDANADEVAPAIMVARRRLHQCGTLGRIGPSARTIDRRYER
jgi:Transposase